MNKTNRIEALKKERDYCRSMIEVCERKLQKFAEDLQANPASAFEYSGNAYSWAALIEMAQIVESLCEKAIDGSSANYKTIDDIAAYVLKRSIDYSRSSSRSTSASANAIDRERIEAWASWAGRLNGFGDF